MTNIHTEQLLRVLLSQAHAAREASRRIFVAGRLATPGHVLE